MGSSDVNRVWKSSSFIVISYLLTNNLCQGLKVMSETMSKVIINAMAACDSTLCIVTSKRSCFINCKMFFNLGSL